MKKITILVASHYIEAALKRLRALGLMHVRHIKSPVSTDVSFIENKLDALGNALFAMRNIIPEEQDERDCQGVPVCIKEINSLIKQKNALLQELEQIQKMLEWYQRWGKVSLSSLDALKRRGLYTKLYIINRHNLRKIASQESIYVIKQKKDMVYLAMVSRSDDDTLGFGQYAEFPEKEYYEARREYLIITDMLRKIDRRLQSLSVYKPSYGKYKINLEKELEFYKVKSSMMSEQTFKYLEGFCPADAVSRVTDAAEQEGWGVLVQEPENPAEVPTLLRNPRWIGIIKPVFEFMGIVPGYKEYDVSSWFLLFLSLFFAMLIGDAGYGLVFLAVTFFAQRKLKETPGELFSLMYVFGTVTLIWGAVTGTWFGVEKIGHLPVFDLFVIERINSFVDTNQTFMMYLCFLIGAIHLTIAHSMIILRFRKSLTVLAQGGWILIVWGLFFLADTLVLSKVFPAFAGWSLVAGATLVTFFSYPQKNMLKAIAISLGNLPLKLVSSFADIVSYIRLFAVGYATVIVAVSFNNMALSVGFDSFIRGLGSTLILFLGHTLNIILGLMAIIVHGVRLNMLEFSSHLGMEWSGIPYSPFRE